MERSKRNFVVVIGTYEACLVCNKTKRSAQRQLAAIRKHFGKDPRHYVTIEEYSEQTGISVDLILKKLNSY